MSDDLISAEKARELLEAATPGRWDTYDTFSATQDGYGISVGDQRPVALLRVIDGGTSADRDIAAAAPDLARTVVALHARLAAVEAERDALRAAVLDTKALLVTCGEGEGKRWCARVEAIAWEALRKLAGGGQ